MLWKVQPEEKKSVNIRTWCHVSSASSIAAGKDFYIDEVYRWGWCVIRSNTKPEHHREDLHFNPFELSDYEVEDQESNDGCSLELVFDVADEWTESEQKYIEQLWSSGKFSAFEENGIHAHDCETRYYGSLEISCIDDTVDVSTPKSTAGSWPF